jgi:hypothetical protein
MLYRVCLGIVAGLSLLTADLSWGQDKPDGPSKLEQLTKDAKKVEGLWTIYHKEQQILVDLKSGQLNQDYLFLTSIARGISQGMIIGGMTWGDDVLWTFRKVGDRLHVLRRNVRFKAKPGSPEANAVKLAYTDSVLYALPILADTPGGHLVDMTRVFMSDDEQIGRMIGAAFMLDRSTVAKVKAFDKNVELQIAAVYQGSPNSSLETVPDARGVQVQVHYSISQLPNTGYKPRKADDRVGYFLVVTKDFSDQSDDQNFVRYVTRWDLQKLDASAKLSPPVEPIKFYLERTLPVNLRPIVRAGIEEWNKAFERIGFANAIEVTQQRDDDQWDPEDVSYNTFRWITAEAGFAMGPSRVNPLTGQILDADIIFDASFLRYWRQEYENFAPPAPMAGAAPAAGDVLAANLPAFLRDRHLQCGFSKGMQHQMGFSAAALAAQGALDARGKLPDEFLEQALKEVVMHEVGHTLGLRHNFKASGWKTLAEIEDPQKPLHEPIVASVMDYSPVNIMPAGAKQTAYYTNSLGPYDLWAVEYGYKVLGDEAAELAKIAARGGEPGLDFATDEDTDSSDPDPGSNRFDLGKDPVAYAARQVKLVSDLMPKILERTVSDGEGYQRVRQAFGVMQSEYWRTIQFAARVPGGVAVHRDHKGDPQGRPPYQLVDAASQRAAMKLITESAFVAPKYDPVLLNSLASTKWSHWGLQETGRTDYAIHDMVSRMQTQVLNQLMATSKLSRIQDGEVKVDPAGDAYTLAEHFKLIVDGIFGELNAPPAGEYTVRNPWIVGYRRNLQRALVKKLAGMIASSSSSGGIFFILDGGSVSSGDGPDDARLLARVHLKDIQAKITAALGKADLKLDDYSKAHLQDLEELTKQVLSAQFTVNAVK